MNNDLISRSALLADIEESVVFSVKDGQPSAEIRGANKITDRIKAAPAVDAVSRGVVEQIMWDRDIAMEQLKEHGIPFGGIAPDVVSVVRCKDCKHTLIDGETAIYCEKWDRWEVPEDFFCGYGKRRNDHEAD